MQQSNQGRGKSQINLERVADTSDVDLDLSEETEDGTALAEIDNDGDGTVDETVEINVPDKDAFRVIGTDGDNVLTGGDADETFVGTSGDDVIIGGDGSDTIDYSDLGEAVTIASAGELDKGSLGTDTLGTFDVDAGTIEVVETVVGAEGETNVVDGTSVQGAVALDVDLATGAFTGNIVEAAGDFQVGEFFSVTLENFVDVLGSDNDDQITGDGQANLLTGAAGADTIEGAGGADTINGGTGDDLLTGGNGSDTFVFTAGDGTDTVTDFDLGEDLISFDGVALADVSADTSNGDTTLSYGDSEVSLVGVVEDDPSALIMIA